MSRKLPRDFYTRTNTLRIARELLGKRLVVPAEDGTRVSGIIVETEAYQGPEDKAAHSYNNRRTKRTEIMFRIGGTAYVYFVYGMYYQFNVITNSETIPHGILIRAVEPEEGIDLMKARRAVKRERDLTSGPGKLCLSLGIDKRYNGADLLGDEIWIEDNPGIPPGKIASGIRIGIDYAEEYVEKDWRFWIKENPFVSRTI
jgi:DNA-3-methyladenine glycosylase